MAQAQSAETDPDLLSRGRARPGPACSKKAAAATFPFPFPFNPTPSLTEVILQLHGAEGLRRARSHRLSPGSGVRVLRGASAPARLFPSNRPLPARGPSRRGAVAGATPRPGKGGGAVSVAAILPGPGPAGRPGCSEQGRPGGRVLLATSAQMGTENSSPLPKVGRLVSPRWKSRRRLRLRVWWSHVLCSSGGRPVLPGCFQMFGARRFGFPV